MADITDEAKEKHKKRMEEMYDHFMNRGWKPNFSSHPAVAPLEMVLVEPRDHPYLKQAICNMSCLIPHAALTIVHSNANEATLKALIKASATSVRLLNVLPDNLTRDEYSILITSSAFWDHFHTPKVLMFQTDSGMRYNNILRFLEYDYIGAPWGWPILGDARIVQGNGGFSLRSVPLMKQIVKDFIFDVAHYEAEDVSFAKHLHDVQPCAILPSKEEAGKFSMEHVATTNDPMAFHQVWKFQPPDLVANILFQGLDPIEPVSHIVIHKAWIESDTGFVASIPEGPSWFSLGIGPSGLLVEEGTKIPFDDTTPSDQKHLLLEISKNKERFCIRVALLEGRLAQTIFT